MPPAKKASGRHRHSAAQLAALHELYEQTPLPTLNQRTALAQSLGLETKSVNSYFQNQRNKRASTKKRPRGVPDILSSAPPSPPPELEGDEDYSSKENPSDHLSQSIPIASNMPLRAEQIDELRKAYTLNPYPTSDEAQVLADAIGLPLQSITNWFQNQYTLDKKQKDELHAVSVAEQGDSSWAFPPAPDQPSLTERGRRSPSSPSVVDDGFPSRSLRASSRRSATPYSSTSAATSLSARQRRARPEPFQLDALKLLFSKTPTPTIEERSALALEIGMDLGKVTNWFRNLRQSARKRAKKIGRRHSGGSDDDFDDGYGTGFYSPSASASVSRSGTPSLLLEREEGRRGRLRPHVRLHSSDDFDDEEDEQDSAHEAVTPNQSQSPSPISSPSHARIFSVAEALHDAMIQMGDAKLAADALLLLEFQATCQ